MSIGVRIRKIREFRGLTQKELGVMCGFNEDNADVRIRQYESNRKIPRKENLKNITDALQVSYAVLMPSSVYEEFFENLLWAEETFGDIDLFSFEVLNERPQNILDVPWKFDARYNKYDVERWISNVPIGIAFQNSNINEFLNEWMKIKSELLQGTITEAEYFEWKINWPESSIKGSTQLLKKSIE